MNSTNTDPSAFTAPEQFVAVGCWVPGSCSQLAAMFLGHAVEMDLRARRVSHERIAIASDGDRIVIMIPTDDAAPVGEAVVRFILFEMDQTGIPAGFFSIWTFDTALPVPCQRLHGDLDLELFVGPTARMSFQRQLQFIQASSRIAARRFKAQHNPSNTP